MAAARERFSMRDYAARMRTAVGPGKCWPFAGGGEENPPLPLITVRRFRWWVDELDDLKSSAEFRQEIPAAPCVGERVRIEAGEENPSPELPKSPKKRSVAEDLPSPKGPHRRSKKIRTMAELFASSSEIEPALNQSDGRNESEGVEEQTRMDFKEAVGLRKRKREGKSERIRLIKERACKQRLNRPSAQTEMLQEPTHKKNPKKRSAEAKNLPQKLPVRSFLKNKKGFIFARKSQKKRRTSTRLIRNDRKSSKFWLHHPQYKSLCKIFSEVLATPSAADGDRAVDKRDASPSSNSTLEKSRNSSVKRVLMVDLNHDAETHDDSEGDIPSAERSNTSTGTDQEAGLPCPHRPTSCVIVGNEEHGSQLRRYLDADLTSFGQMPESQPGCRCFIGLPLNSQGELVQSHPDTRFVERYQNQNNMLGSSQAIFITSNEVFDSGPHSKVNQELNFTEITGWGRPKAQISELVMDTNGFLQSDSNKTIRLMGKDVVIGGRNKDCRTGRSFSSRISVQNLPKHWNQPELIASRSFGSSNGNLRNLPESPLNFYMNSGDASFGAGLHYPTTACYQKSIEAHQERIRYHDHIHPPENPPRRSLDAKYSESSARAPNSSQSSSTSAVTATNSNSEFTANTGIKEGGYYRIMKF